MKVWHDVSTDRRASTAIWRGTSSTQAHRSWAREPRRAAPQRGRAVSGRQPSIMNNRADQADHLRICQGGMLSSPPCSALSHSHGIRAPTPMQCISESCQRGSPAGPQSCCSTRSVPSAGQYQAGRWLPAACSCARRKPGLSLSISIPILILVLGTAWYLPITVCDTVASD